MTKFLLIDDDKVARKNLTRLFRQCSLRATVTELSNADSAMELMKLQKFDVVFLDYSMPGRDGLEMLLSIRDTELNGDVSVVMMLEQFNQLQHNDCLKAGALEVLVKKNVSSDQLMNVVTSAEARREVLSKRKDHNVVSITAGKDALTQIQSRAEFEHSIRKTVGLRTNNKAAILLLNINNFRSVNELYGVEVGDQILKSIAERLVSAGKQMNCVARVGGDEFAILINAYETALELKRTANDLLTLINKPIWIEQQQIQVSASIGMSTYPQDSGEQEELYKFAFIALYRAKLLGRNQVCFFEQEMQDTVLRKHQIERAILRVIAAKSFRLAYQPIYDGTTSKLVGAEALIRWPEEEIQFYPDEFIPVAETSGAILEIGKFAIQQSLAQLAQWRTEPYMDISVNVNLSPRQLVDKSLPQFIRQQLEHNALPADALTLELTETALMENAEEVSSVLMELKAIGCNIALDDFGTGFSSISHLLNFPIDIVKIDKSVLPISDEQYKQHAITQGLTMMIKRLGASIVVEGIETPYQHRFVKALCVDKVQGYLYAKPAFPNYIVLEDYDTAPLSKDDCA